MTFNDPVSEAFENNVGKGETFSPFPTMFSTQSMTEIIILAAMNLFSAIDFHLDRLCRLGCLPANALNRTSLKYNLSCGKDQLTLYQPTSFRLLQTKRICRRQFPI